MRTASRVLVRPLKTERFSVALRLSNGALWPTPITHDVTEEFARSLKPGASKVALRDPEGVMLAVLNVEEAWRADKRAEAESVFGTTIMAHPWG